MIIKEPDSAKSLTEYCPIMRRGGAIERESTSHIACSCMRLQYNLASMFLALVPTLVPSKGAQIYMEFKHINVKLKSDTLNMFTHPVSLHKTPIHLILNIPITIIHAP